eukprot:Gb_38464 [translate_table: standard]
MTVGPNWYQASKETHDDGTHEGCHTIPLGCERAGPQRVVRGQEGECIEENDVAPFVGPIITGLLQGGHPASNSLSPNSIPLNALSLSSPWYTLGSSSFVARRNDVAPFMGPIITGLLQGGHPTANVPT